MNAERQDRQERQRWAPAARGILAHPLLLLLVGALLTSILLPRCTRNWQQYEKELEIKRELAQDISRSSGTFLRAIKAAQVTSLVALRVEQAPEPEYAGRLRERWEVEGEVLGAEMQIYFPDSELKARWSRFVLAAQESYDLLALGEDREGRAAHLVEIGKALTLPREVRGELELLARPPEQIRWLVRGGLRPLEFQFVEASYRLIDLMEQARAAVVQELLDSRSVL
jgi:hypothetical protein